MTNAKKYFSLEDVLGKDATELTAVKQGEYEVDKLGEVPFTALNNTEYKQIKKDCIKMTPNGTGGMEPEVDEDKMMSRVVIAAVDKDTRTNFTFASKALLDKLTAANAKEGKPPVTTADEALSVLLSPGEIMNFAVKVQNSSGFGQKAAKETQEAVKNS
ncbi:hypothetical protein [Paenibacillus sp. L3-i20]|uniref:phage tail assembly chaperone n=1 Tax=Paenibacillus sp. L3-i20 TaxID=2905833 RepID=UPI001EDE39AE|nr:hypothetical protein [Paenibacillus sp. L3-i20]GKU79288.1 hypothetical protein L3i20_v236850 [Paenibacillus sp. L3-i20]